MIQKKSDCTCLDARKLGVLVSLYLSFYHVLLGRMVKEVFDIIHCQSGARVCQCF